MSDYQNQANVQSAVMGQLIGGGYQGYSAEQLRLVEERQEAAEAAHRIAMDCDARRRALDLALRHERNADDAIKAARKFAAFLADG